MGVYDDDLESEAIAKCAKALSLIENNAKVRVIKHLLDRFELIETNNAISSISNQANVSNLTPTTFAQIESHTYHTLKKWWKSITVSQMFLQYMS